jgi:hypothetical protein
LLAAVVAQSVYFACGLKAMEFVFCFTMGNYTGLFKDTNWNLELYPNISVILDETHCRDFLNDEIHIFSEIYNRILMKPY